MTGIGPRPAAVLLDVGGVFLLPSHDRVAGAFDRAGCHVPTDRLDRAHYEAAAAFSTELDAEADWAGCWLRYLEAYIEACAPEPVDAAAVDPVEVHRHVDSEFADAALWLRPIDGSKEGAAQLADTGVRLGVVSNADGVMGERLRELEIVQVGPGLGVEIACVIDSGAVGIMKPDPRIFRLALDAVGVGADEAWYVGDIPGIDVVGAQRAGLCPILMDPLGLHHDAPYERVGSLSEVADLIASA